MRYWFHPESHSHYTTGDDALEVSFDGMSVEVTRAEYLEAVALDALWSAIRNDARVPDDAVDAAAEMIEQGVFGPSEECVDEFGVPRAEYVIAVASAKRSWNNR